MTSTRELTARGKATRDRIIEAAAELIYREGVHATNNDLVRKAAHVSGSQLSHYFPDKQSLVKAVLRKRADSMMGLDREPPQGPLDSIDALRDWADGFVSNADVRDGGAVEIGAQRLVGQQDPGLRAGLRAGRG